MKGICTILILLFVTKAAYSQKVDSIFFNLYTDSLKKGVYNYINVDAKLSNGSYQPLNSQDIEFRSSVGKWDGNSLILERDIKVDSVIVTATLKSNPELKKTITIYLQKVEVHEAPKTEQELLDEWKRKSKKKSKKDLAYQPQASTSAICKHCS